jgi:hypothetical protein
MRLAVTEREMIESERIAEPVTLKLLYFTGLLASKYMPLMSLTEMLVKEIPAKDIVDNFATKADVTPGADWLQAIWPATLST